MATIAQIQLAGVLANKDTQTILAEVLEAHPAAKTSKGCVAWYRSHAIHDEGPTYVAARRGLRFDEKSRRWGPEATQEAIEEAISG